MPKLERWRNNRWQEINVNKNIMKVYTREELTNLTGEEVKAMTKKQRINVQEQGKAFLIADIERFQQGVAPTLEV